MKASADAREAPGTRGARSLLAAGTSSALVGIGLSAGGSPELGSWVSVGSLLVLVYGLHRFGRSGADLPPRAEEPARRRKKKKKSAGSAERPASEPSTRVSEGQDPEQAEGAPTGSGKPRSSG